MRIKKIPESVTVPTTPEACIRKGREIVPTAEVIPLNVYRLAAVRASIPFAVVA